jgi:hypothetical protein
MSKTNSLSILAGIALALACNGAAAQAKPKPKPAPAPAPAAASADTDAGVSEVNFFGNLSDSDLGTTLIAGVGFGKFLSESLELKVTQQMIYFDGGGFTFFNYSPYVSAEYQIKPAQSPVVFFVGGGLGLSLGSIESGSLGGDFFTYSLFVTPVGGLKYFVDERTALTWTMSYQFPLVEEICGDVDCIDSETTTLSNVFGVSIYY